MPTTATNVTVSAHFLLCSSVWLISVSSFLPDFYTFLWSITTFLLILNHTATHYYTTASNCLCCQAWKSFCSVSNDFYTKLTALVEEWCPEAGGRGQVARLPSWLCIITGFCVFRGILGWRWDARPRGIVQSLLHHTVHVLCLRAGYLLRWCESSRAKGFHFLFSRG